MSLQWSWVCSLRKKTNLEENNERAVTKSMYRSSLQRSGYGSRLSATFEFLIGHKWQTENQMRTPGLHISSLCPPPLSGMMSQARCRRGNALTLRGSFPPLESFFRPVIQTWIWFSFNYFKSIRWPQQHPIKSICHSLLVNILLADLPLFPSLPYHLAALTARGPHSLITALPSSSCTATCVFPVDRLCSKATSHSHYIPTKWKPTIALSSMAAIYYQRPKNSHHKDALP